MPLKTGNFFPIGERAHVSHKHSADNVICSSDGGQKSLASVLAEITASLQALSASPKFVASATEPTDTGLLWIDTTPTTGGLKYYNGTAWAHVPVAYT